MGQQLRALIAITEHPGFFASIHMAAQNCLSLTAVPGDATPSSDLSAEHKTHMWYIDLHGGQTLKYIK